MDKFELNKLMKEKRVEMGLSLKQLENKITEKYEKVVISKPFINQIELCNQDLLDVSIYRLYVLAEALEIDFNVILDYLKKVDIKNRA